jgi:ribose transport system permease protein
VTIRAQRLQLLALQHMPLVLLVSVFLVFSLLNDQFFSTDTLVNAARQASYIGILAVGMTFVLLTAGIDLSVGSMLYVAAVLVGNLIASNPMPVFAACLLMIAVGAVLGAINAVLVTWLRVIPFVVTLATLTAYRGWALSSSDSREINFPQAVTKMARGELLGIPTPVFFFAAVVLAGHLVLTRTLFGRQVYAVGEDRKSAERAGIPVRRVLFTVFVISGALAGLSAFVAAAQFGTITPYFGRGDEFDAIAAAVLGGTSLFGGRGSVWPGTVVGSLLVQLVAAGLVFTAVDLYLTPMVTAAIIFLAVFLDSLRSRQLHRLQLRTIMSRRADADEATAKSHAAVAT